ncbi:hypothetical protein CEXT_720161 [Caerostris extrusa]|uniref:Uncharacterized protein n=1 Tax=Caerostris extrusa TaxID=172846 RepID=A0AAV4T0B1_CAEEX|nr:hypothetical protein CEXT_720161 [Caerostris extrusa]
MATIVGSKPMFSITNEANLTWQRHREGIRSGSIRMRTARRDRCRPPSGGFVILPHPLFSPAILLHSILLFLSSAIDLVRILWHKG